MFEYSSTQTVKHWLHSRTAAGLKQEFAPGGGLTLRACSHTHTHTQLHQWKVAPRQLPQHRTSPSLYENSSRQICRAMLLAGAICGGPLRWEIRNRNDIYCCAASSRGNFAVTEAQTPARLPPARPSARVLGQQSRWSATKRCTLTNTVQVNVLCAVLQADSESLLIPIISEPDSAHCMALKKTKTFIWVISSWAAPLQHLLPLMSCSPAVVADASVCLSCYWWTSMQSVTVGPIWYKHDITA